MSNVEHGSDRARTAVTAAPAARPQGWFARQWPANRRRRHAEAERQFFITSVVTRSEVIGIDVPDAVDDWAAATSLAWLQEHRTDRAV